MKPRGRWVPAGVGLILFGGFLMWRGMTTPPGQMAFEIPRRPDWSSTEATMIGLAFCALGIYVALFFERGEK